MSLSTKFRDIIHIVGIQNQIEKGKKRYTFNAVYIINILNFNLVELKQENNPVSRFRMKELETNRTLSTKYTLIFIELRKFAKRAAMNHKDRQTYIKKMNSERDRINQWEYAMEQAKTEEKK